MAVQIFNNTSYVFQEIFYKFSKFPEIWGGKFSNEHPVQTTIN